MSVPMPLWDKLRHELDRAGRAAQGALDEGKLRLDAFRARQLADKAAQALGYAVYRAREDGRQLDEESYARLSGSIRDREAEANRSETQLRDIAASRGRSGGGAESKAADAAEPPAGGATPATSAGEPPTPDVPPAPSTEPHQPL